MLTWMRIKRDLTMMLEDDKKAIRGAWSIAKDLFHILTGFRFYRREGS